MEIKTKYNTGDRVWGMYQGVPTRIKVERITVSLYTNYERDGINIRYAGQGGVPEYEEGQCFLNIDDLLEDMKRKALCQLEKSRRYR